MSVCFERDLFINRINRQNWANFNVKHMILYRWHTLNIRKYSIREAFASINADAWLQHSLPVYNWNYCIMNVAFILWLHVRTTKSILKQFSFYCWCCWIAIIIFIVIARFFFSFLLRCFSLIHLYVCLFVVEYFCAEQRTWNGWIR